jgi:hypothetical protein
MPYILGPVIYKGICSPAYVVTVGGGGTGLLFVVMSSWNSDTATATIMKRLRADLTAWV